MPVFPIQFAPLVKTGGYRHMAKHDALIWERFIDLYAGNFLGVDYDVALGGFVLEVAGLLESDVQGWQYSTALKVDAVLLQEGQVWVVEVRPSAGTSAVGAALCYALLAEQDGFTPYPIIPTIVTDRMNPDAKWCAGRLGLTVVEVPEVAAGPGAARDVSAVPGL